MQRRLNIGGREKRPGREIPDVRPGSLGDHLGLVRLQRLTRHGPLAETGDMIVAGSPNSLSLDAHRPTAQVTP